MSIQYSSSHIPPATLFFIRLCRYCWGDASTTYGAIRVADGHPAPYRISTFELGNEQVSIARRWEGGELVGQPSIAWE